MSQLDDDLEDDKLEELFDYLVDLIDCVDEPAPEEDADDY